jgi:UDP-GlcNAc3NAcA epimerase
VGDSGRSILTDSGGVQKEAFFHRVSCIMLRDEAEWLETVEMRWNVLVGADRDTIIYKWLQPDIPVEINRFMVTGRLRI